jgi:hypothetical protein
MNFLRHINYFFQVDEYRLDEFTKIFLKVFSPFIICLEVMKIL